jgi:hypothetical protein
MQSNNLTTYVARSAAGAVLTAGFRYVSDHLTVGKLVKMARIT